MYIRAAHSQSGNGPGGSGRICVTLAFCRPKITQKCLSELFECLGAKNYTGRYTETRQLIGM